MIVLFKGLKTKPISDSLPCDRCDSLYLPLGFSFDNFDNFGYPCTLNIVQEVEYQPTQLVFLFIEMCYFRFLKANSWKISSMLKHVAK